ncbi:MAG TPA: DMT family transporter [Bacteroidia bacterium]|nr:DMT family transporter [Bacteroidia bacterium]
MNFIGINFALLATLSWSLCIFPFTQAARRLGSVPLNHFRLVLAVLILGTGSLFYRTGDFVQLFSSDYLGAWLWLGLSGIIGLSLGDHFGFSMYAILGPRVGSVLTTFAPASTLIISYFLIHEELSWIGIVGMFVTIVGVIWISLSRGERQQIPDHGHGSIRKGVIYGLLAAICQGAGLVLAKRGMLSEHSLHPDVNPVHATFIRLLIGTLSLFLFSLLSGKLKIILRPVFQNKDNGIRFAVAGTLFGPVIGVTLSLFTVTFIKASVAQTIFSLVPVFALMLSYFLLKEKFSLRSFIGVVVAIAGVIILIWREQLKNLL